MPNPNRSLTTARERLVRPVRHRLARLWTEFPGEIVGDEFAEWIEKLAADPANKTLIEIGSGAGDGSTRAFVTGAARRSDPPKLFCIEPVASRAAELRKRYADKPFVHTYEAGTATPADYMSADEARAWFTAYQSGRGATVEQVLASRDYELRSIEQHGTPPDAITRIRAEHGVQDFDVALLDGSSFLGRTDLAQVYGATWLLLDDIQTMKNHANCVALIGDPKYRLVFARPNVRNGFAVFERV